MKLTKRTGMRAILAWMLSALMVCSNMEYVSATSTIVEDASVMMDSEITVSGDAEISMGDVSGGQSVSENVPTESAPEVLFENMTTASTATVLDSGEKNGIVWTITNDGVLTIGGEDTSEAALNDDMPWLDYRNSITKVVITAKNVKDTYKWFYSCANITEIDLSEFETSSVTDMSYMFSLCSSLTGLDLSGFDTSNVTNMSHMLWGCSSLSSLDITGMDTSKVTHMDSMFSYCSNLSSLDLSGFKTSKVTAMNNMFSGCSGLIDLRLSGFDTANVTDMSNMFFDCSSLISVDVSGFDTSNVTRMDGMFYNCSSITGLDVSGFDTSKTVDMGGLFYSCSSLTDLELSGFDTSAVTDMSFMFFKCSNMTSLDLSAFDTSKVNNMMYMFKDCSSLTSLDLSVLDISALTYVTDMFTGCNGLKRIKVFKNLSMSVALPSDMYDEEANRYTDFPLGVTEDMWLYVMDYMGEVNGISWMITEDGTLIINGTDASTEATATTEWGWLDYKEHFTKAKVFAKNVKSTSGWFSGLSKLESVDLSGFDTAAVTDMSNMFKDCKGLTKMDLANFDLSKVTNAQGMLNGCIGIEEIRMPANLLIDIEVPKTLYNYIGEPLTEYFPKGQPQATWYYAEKPVKEGDLYVTAVCPQTYTGKAIKPEIQVYDGSTCLVEKKDYTISYKNNTNANDASDAKIAPTIIVKGKGNYTKQDTVTFQILAKDISAEDVVVQELVAVAGKKVQKPVPKLTYNGKKLVNKKDFTVSYPDMSEANPDAYKAPGTYRVVVTGMGNFTGERVLTFTIGSTLMSKTKIAKIPNQTYTGSAIKPEITVTHGKKQLVKDTDYKVTYANNEAIGKATVTITGMGDYVGSKSTTFQITGQSIAKAQVEGIVAKTYNGVAQTQDITVKLGEQTLVAGTDYEVAYTKNTNAGTATMTIKGIGSYTGSIKKTFKIQPRNIENNATCMWSDQMVYEKGGATNYVGLVIDGITLKEKQDFTVTYSNHKKVTKEGDKKLPIITIKGKGNYTGTIKKTYTIVQKDLGFDYGSESIRISVPDVAYSKIKGKYVSKPVLTDSNGKKLVAGTDYEKNIVYTLTDGTALDKKSVVEAGQTVTATVTGKGNYKGTISATYRITPAAFKNAKVTITAQVYTGKEIALSAEDFTSVKVGKDTLTYGQDIEIVEGSYKNNIKKGTASVTIRGKGNYGGEKTVKFKIVAKEMIWFWRLFD